LARVGTIYATGIDEQADTINDQITTALTAGQDHETLPAATAVQANPADQTRTSARTVGSGPAKAADQPS
jgi:hypothetical protein